MHLGRVCTITIHPLNYHKQENVYFQGSRLGTIGKHLLVTIWNFPLHSKCMPMANVLQCLCMSSPPDLILKTLIINP